jgi:hypothetical protein
MTNPEICSLEFRVAAATNKLIDAKRQLQGSPLHQEAINELKNVLKEDPKAVEILLDQQVKETTNEFDIPTFKKPNMIFLVHGR